jgi:hypothetical protein
VNSRGSLAGFNIFVFRACAKGGSTSEGDGNESPKAQISGGKAAFFANALRTTRSTSEVATSLHAAKIWVSILLAKTSQIILDNVVVLDKESANFGGPGFENDE